MNAKAKVQRHSRKLIFIALFSLLSIAVSGIVFPFGGLLNPGPFCTLANQIAAANTDQPVGNCPAGSGPDIIDITHNVYLTEPLPAITSQITINGNGFRISGTNSNRIFDVQGGSLTVSKLVMERGAPRFAQGGAIRIAKQGTLVLKDSSIHGSRANMGGAIYVEDGRATLDNILFESNTAAMGGAIFIDSGTATIRGTVFRTNVSQTHGGAITNFGGSLVINSSTFHDNTARTVGGGIFSDNDAIIVTRSRFSNNTAESGAGIFSGSVENSGTHQAIVDHSEFTLNSAEKDGGAIFKRFGKMSVTNSRVIANAANDRGGGFFTDSGALHIVDTVLSKNRATMGRDLYNDRGRVTLGISIVSEDSASSDSDRSFNNAGSLTITKYESEDNSAAVGQGAGYTE